MEGAGHQQMGLTVTAGENNSNPVLIGRMIRPEDNDSRSDGSDNLDGASGDDQEVAVVADGQPPRRKKYHRHTPQQIQELETYGFAYLFLSFKVYYFLFVIWFGHQKKIHG